MVLVVEVEVVALVALVVEVDARLVHISVINICFKILNLTL
jgi:hypothetical protein